MCFFLIAINTRSARIEETSIYPYSVTLLESPVFGDFGLLGILGFSSVLVIVNPSSALPLITDL